MYCVIKSTVQVYYRILKSAVYVIMFTVCFGVCDYA